MVKLFFVFEEKVHFFVSSFSLKCFTKVFISEAENNLYYERLVIMLFEKEKLTL